MNLQLKIRWKEIPHNEMGVGGGQGGRILYAVFPFKTVQLKCLNCSTQMFTGIFCFKSLNLKEFSHLLYLHQ